MADVSIVASMEEDLVAPHSVNSAICRTHNPTYNVLTNKLHNNYALFTINSSHLQAVINK